MQISQIRRYKNNLTPAHAQVICYLKTQRLKILAPYQNI